MPVTRIVLSTSLCYRPVIDTFTECLQSTLFDSKELTLLPFNVHFRHIKVGCPVAQSNTTLVKLHVQVLKSQQKFSFYLPPCH